MNSKILLLSVAVIAVGLFALPQTMSLFAGQHTWYDPKELSCYKCHMDIKDEISTSLVHNEPWAQACDGCHKTPSNLSNASNNGGSAPFFWDSTNSTGRIGANRTKQGFHAATTLECTACHSGVAVSAYNPKNYGDGINNWNGTAYVWPNGTWKPHSNSLGNPQEAHTAFALNATSTRTLYNDNGTAKPISGNQSVILLKGANTACVGCHTHIWVNATWTRNSGYAFNADETSGQYTMTFTLNNTPKVSGGVASDGT